MERDSRKDSTSLFGIIRPLAMEPVSEACKREHFQMFVRTFGRVIKISVLSLDSDPQEQAPLLTNRQISIVPPPPRAKHVPATKS